MSVLLYGCTIWTDETLGKKSWELNKDAIFAPILEAVPYKTAAE